MDTLIEFVTPLEPWHWVALGLVLLGVELMIGTFDLLWVGAAALATALFSALVPDTLAGPGLQFAFFAVSSVALIVLGRSVFGDWRNKETDKPMLNKRMDAMIGRRALVTSGFSAGSGRVKIGDTEWLAHAVEGEDFAEGATVLVKGVEATVVKVVAG